MEGSFLLQDRLALIDIKRDTHLTENDAFLGLTIQRSQKVRESGGNIIIHTYWAHIPSQACNDSWKLHHRRGTDH